MIAITCVAAVLAMVSFAIWPVFLVSLGPEWGLTNTEIGWISGAYFIGYVAATPILVGLTDVIDARRIFIGGCLTAALGCVGFAMVTEGFWGAVLTWCFVGAGLAGTYMPGLQILNARLSDDQRLKAVPFYTSCFGIGTGGSFYLNGYLLIHFDHIVAAWLGCAAAILAALAVFWCIRRSTPAEQPQAEAGRHPLDLRPAFRNRLALGYIFAYGAHTYELFAYRGWSFAMFAYIGATAQPALSLSTVTILVSLLTLTGMAASIIGARYCLAYGRHRVITIIGALSVGFAVLSALALDGPVWLALTCLWIYNVCIMLDSGALTAGTVAAAPAHERGALLAVHSMVGFTGGALGGPAVGMMLDLGGGETSLDAWFWAILVMGVGSAIVALIQWQAWRRRGHGV
ncbi:MAG: MFS transporter [Candidatus Puniceispirillaceae bacterium]